jgi:hypothetical protein
MAHFELQFNNFLKQSQRHWLAREIIGCRRLIEELVNGLFRNTHEALFALSSVLITNQSGTAGPHK